MAHQLYKIFQGTEEKPTTDGKNLGNSGQIYANFGCEVLENKRTSANDQSLSKRSALSRAMALTQIFQVTHHGEIWAFTLMIYFFPPHLLRTLTLSPRFLCLTKSLISCTATSNAKPSCPIWCGGFGLSGRPKYPPSISTLWLMPFPNSKDFELKRKSVSEHDSSTLVHESRAMPWTLTSGRCYSSRKVYSVGDWNFT